MRETEDTELQKKNYPLESEKNSEKLLRRVTGEKISCPFTLVKTGAIAGENSLPGAANKKGRHVLVVEKGRKNKEGSRKGTNERCSRTSIAEDLNSIKKKGGIGTFT